jgi:hypothetical protein
MSISLVGDFFVKSTGKADAYGDFVSTLPLSSSKTGREHVRVLMLTCLTSYYRPLWAQTYSPNFNKQQWAKRDQRLSDSHFASLESDWTYSTALRTSFARRQALLELDVLCAQSLGLTLDELQDIYRIQFPVFRAYERNTFYDQEGRIAYLDGDQSYGFSTPDWKKIKHLRTGTVTRALVDNTLPDGPHERIIEYHAPFDCMDREADYAEAWAFFEDQSK